MPGPGSLGRLTRRIKDSLGRPDRGRGAGGLAGDGRDGRGSSDAGADRRPDQPAAPDLSGTDGIAVGYAPEHDGDPDPGEVVWAWVPFEDDPTDGKDRPVLVIGFEGAALAAVQLSSKDHHTRRDSEDWVEVGRGAWDTQNRVSYADASRLLRLDASTVRREGSALDRGRFDAVLERVRAIHGWTD